METGVRFSKNSLPIRPPEKGKKKTALGEMPKDKLFSKAISFVTTGTIEDTETTKSTKAITISLKKNRSCCCSHNSLNTPHFKDGQRK